MDFINNAISGITDQWTALKETVQDAIDTGTRVVKAGLETIPQVLPQMLPAAAAALATLNYRGTQGSWIDVNYPIKLSARFMLISDEAIDRLGRPLMAVRSLGTLSGFCLCKNSQIIIPGSIEEESAVNAFLDAGFYIE